MQFYKRPVLSIVVSVLILILGVLALVQLPISQFPEITPPEVNVNTKYTGANAEACVKAVVTPLERAINGVPGMAYMNSVSGNDGSSEIQIIFKPGTDPEVAAVNVQNRIAAVIDELPEEAIKAGVIVEKVQNSMLLYLNVLSNDKSLDEKFLYNYADINLLPELRRIEGVGFADILGSRDYAMRIWLKPDKLLAYDISATEVMEKLRAQNVEAAPGKIGESSGKKAQTLQYVLKYSGKFNTREQYEQVILRGSATGQLLRLKDVAEVDFDSQEYDVISKENGKPSAAILLKQRPGTNASQVIAAVKAKMKQIKQENFLPGMDYTVSYDVSAFLDASIKEVIKTLVEAFVLVALVVFLFLQDWRSTLVPILAIPVSLVGTFFFMQLLDFSVNLVTLFALVLAIGIVVDNAIVVVEAVHAKMEAEKIGPYKATERAMKEISGAIIAITLVMSAVFIPVSFLEGSTGIFFREFSLTMAAAIVLSGVTALTLTPALCVLLLKEPQHGTAPKHFLDHFFAAFNRAYNRLADTYVLGITKIGGRRLVLFGSLLVFMALIAFSAQRLPTGFIPEEDQGAVYANIVTPPGSTLERTEQVVDAVQKKAQSMAGVDAVSSLVGYSILSEGVGAVYGMNLISLKNWSERDQSDKAFIAALRDSTKNLQDANIEFFTPPPIPGYGNSSGFELRLLDKSGSGNLQKMQAVTDSFVAVLNQSPVLQNVFTTYNVRFPQYLLQMDAEKAAEKGITVSNAMSTLQVLIGSEYATNFIRFGQLYRVMIQSLPSFRAQPDDILRLYIKNEAGEMIPFSSFLHLEKVYGPEQLTRYNMYTSALVNGQPRKGYSSGQAIAAIKALANEKLPRGYGYDFAGSTRDQANAGNQSIYIFVICLLFVYLLLSAQYESFLLPMPVILSLPAGILGAFVFLQLFGLENNIYAQVAMIMLIGILGKNAILVVEFAALKQKAGSPVMEAAITAAKDRLRPILMTSFAFIAGLLPLMVASGAGEIGNRTIGTAAAGGMLLGTLLGIYIIPGLFVVFGAFLGKVNRQNRRQTPITEQS